MNSVAPAIDNILIKGRMNETYAGILTPHAMSFVAELHRKFNGRRKELLEKRQENQRLFDLGEKPEFLRETLSIREGSWSVAPIPTDLKDRRTEITGPVDRKMVINALNSGAKVFMADFEDSNSPTWKNCIEGQVNLKDAINRNIDFTAANGKHYALKGNVATLKVRPRGWHLTEKHLLVDDEPVSASIFDFGLFFFHNASTLISQGAGPYFYLPKLESHLEARLWNDIFVEAQDMLGLAQGSVKVTVLIETITAAFQMEEIIYELRNHMAGLNAGRWDYIFSVIKKFRNDPEFILPDRAQVTMSAPFMSAYAQLLVKTCHKRGAHAIGGMSAFIPAKDEEVNKRAFEKVGKDKQTEANLGYDGTWVAHPFLVPLAIETFDKVLKDNPHQKHVLNEDVSITGADLLNTNIKEAKITEEGVRVNINVGILYIESWLNGTGAAALYNLMEDAATAEISRAQLWQWIHNAGTKLNDGRDIDWALYEQLFNEEKAKAAQMLGDERVSSGNLSKAVSLFDRLIKEKEFEEFLTLEAYNFI